MSDNTKRFSGKVEAYERYRERYPTDAVLNLLRQWCNLTPAQTVADIGAGTGMLSEVFLENGNRVIAVEPNEDMRQACEALHDRWPRLEVVNATAEATSLSDASVDIVAAGRAFHWFDTQRALAEFQRILKPGGWVALVSLGREHAASEQNFAFEKIMTNFGTDPTYSRERYRVHERLEELFPVELHREEIPGEQQLDWDTLEGFMQSLSMVPPKDSPKYHLFEAALREHFQAHAHNGLLTMKTTCWVSAGRL
jgi:ubiquinone/menaquinone biosynthesis C-methylase UbiE